jgi:hypothetical protein
MSRDLNKAVPFLKQFAEQLIFACQETLGLKIFIVDVDRDYKVQMAYYAQNRQPLSDVNALRRAAGLPLITEQQNAKKITWTMNSKHVTNLDDGNPNNDLSRAIDIGLKDENGRYCGDGDEDLNGDGKHDYEQVWRLAEELGNGKIKAGGRFGDEPHLEMA